MQFRRFTFGLALGAVIVTLALASCAGSVTAGHSSVSAGVTSGHSSITDQVGAPPVTLADTSPGRLGVSIGVTIGGYDAASRNTTEIAIQFTSGGRLVQFTKGETLACTGAQPTALTTSFDHKYATSAVANTVITCVYTSGHATASIRFQIPNAPAILAPAEGASVARGYTTPVSYRAQGDIEGIVALGAQQKTIAHISTPGQATLDTAGFSAGPGTIVLTQFPTVANAQAPTFASLQTNCTAMAAVDVTWA